MVVIKSEKHGGKAEQSHLVRYSDFCLLAVREQRYLFSLLDVHFLTVVCSVGIFVPCEEWVVHVMQQRCLIQPKVRCQCVV